MLKNSKVGLSIKLFILLVLIFISAQVALASQVITVPGWAANMAAPFNVVTNWYTSTNIDYSMPGYIDTIAGFMIDPCSPSKTISVSVGVNSYNNLVVSQFTCAPILPNLKVSCSGSSDSNKVVNLSKIYWTTNVTATDSQGNIVDVSKATFKWKDDKTTNSESMDTSFYKGALATNNVTVSLSGTSTLVQCTLPPIVPLQVACYGTSGDSSTNWTSLSNSADYYGNKITPNIVWNDGKTGAIESTSGSTNNITANYTDIYGQKSTDVTKKCIPSLGTSIAGIGSHPTNEFDSKYSASYGSKGVKIDGSLQDAISNDLQELENLSQTADHETAKITVVFKNGTKVDYTKEMPPPTQDSGGGGTVADLEAQIKSDASLNGGVDSMNFMHNHPTRTINSLYLPPDNYGYPPSSTDLFGAVNAGLNFPKATITNLVVDANGNVWSYSVPAGSNFAKGVPILNAINQALAGGIKPNVSVNDANTAKDLVNVTNYDGGRYNNYYGSGDSTKDYLKAVQVSGAVIAPVSTLYPKLK